MIRLGKPMLNETNCRQICKVFQIQHVQSLSKRNFGALTQTQHRDLLRKDNPLCHHKNKAIRFKSSVASAADAALSLETSAAVANPVAPGFFESVYHSLSSSAPVGYMQQTLIEIHDFTGLPWWASIIACTILFRSIVTLPLTVYQHKITARLEKISLEMPAIVEELKKEAAMAMRHYKWTEQHTKRVYQRSFKQQWNNLVVRDNCHPAKTFIVLWAQIPLWIFQSMAIRNMIQMLPDPTSLQAQIVVTEMTVGGFGWIPNLTEVDNSYILPVALGLLNLGIIEIQSMLRTRPSTRFQSIITNVFRGLSIFMVPIACTVPSALTVYWVTSSSYGLFQNLLLAAPNVRRTFGIPKTNSELENPYEQLWLKMKQRTGMEEATVVMEKAERIDDTKSKAIKSHANSMKSKK